MEDLELEADSKVLEADILKENNDEDLEDDAVVQVSVNFVLENDIDELDDETEEEEDGLDNDVDLEETKLVEDDNGPG